MGPLGLSASHGLGRRQQLGETGGSESFPESRVTLKVEGKPLDFLVDTGAENSLLLNQRGKCPPKLPGSKGPQGPNLTHGLPKQQWTWEWVG